MKYVVLQVLAESDQDPLTDDLLAAPHAMVELQAFLAKTAMTAATTLMDMFPRVQAVLLLLLNGLLFRGYLLWV